MTILLVVAGVAVWLMILLAAIACGRAAARPQPKRPRIQRFWSSHTGESE